MVGGKGISEGGLSVSSKSGIAVSKSTQHLNLYQIAEIMNIIYKSSLLMPRKKALAVLMIDDITNIHTKRKTNRSN